MTSRRKRKSIHEEDDCPNKKSDSKYKVIETPSIPSLKIALPKFALPTTELSPFTPRQPPKFSVPGSRMRTPLGELPCSYLNEAAFERNVSPGYPKFALHDSQLSPATPLSEIRDRLSRTREHSIDNETLPISLLRWSPSPKKKRTFLVRGGVSDLVQSLVDDVEDSIELACGYQPQIVESEEQVNALVVLSVSRWNRFCYHVELDDATCALLIDMKQQYSNLEAGNKVILGSRYTTLTVDVYINWKVCI